MEITINKTVYQVKDNLGAVLIYERLTGDVKKNNIEDFAVYAYAMIMANNDDLCLTFDEFIRQVDNDTLEQISGYLNERRRVCSQLQNNNYSGDVSKKKAWLRFMQRALKWVFRRSTSLPK